MESTGGKPAVITLEKSLNAFTILLGEIFTNKFGLVSKLSIILIPNLIIFYRYMIPGTLTSISLCFGNYFFVFAA